MGNPLRATAAVALTTLLGACFIGPHQLRRSVDDWDQKIYVNSPWWNAAMWIVPVIPTCTAVAFALDFAITDPWAFWFDDAWDGSGTGYRHMPIDWTDGAVDCLFSPRSRWTRVAE